MQRSTKRCDSRTLMSRRVGDVVLVLRADVERVAKGRTVTMGVILEGSATRVESSEDTGPRSAPIVVVEGPPAKETIVETAVLRG